MPTARTAITSVAIGLNAASAISDIASAPYVRSTAAAVDVPQEWLRPLGLLKGAGVLGLLLSTRGMPLIGPVATARLVAFYGGALGAHLRAGDRSAALTIPGALLILAAAALAVNR